MLDKTLFYRVFHYSAQELFWYASSLLEATGYTVKMSETPGETEWLVATPPADHDHNGLCLVAHLDTIIRKDGVELVFQGPVVRNSKGVLGADDRAGVYAILATVLHTDRRPPIVFTNFEESGGLGVKALCNALTPDGVPVLFDFVEFNAVRLFVELDRANANDYVYYSYECPDEVMEWVESFGFHEESGSYSDVADLTSSCRVPHVNLSIGYRQQHGKSEWLSVPDMLWTMGKVWAMLHTPDVPLVTMTDEQIDGPPLRVSYSKYAKYDKYDKHDKYAVSQHDWGAYSSVDTGTDLYNTFASCFICSERDYCHDDWMVCRSCYQDEVESEEADDDDVPPPREVVWDLSKDTYVYIDDATPGNFVRLSGT